MAIVEELLQREGICDDFQKHAIIELTDSERESMKEILSALPPLDLTSVNESILTEIQIASQKFPRRVSEQLFRFRRNSNRFGTLLFRNVPCDAELPPTPKDGRLSRDKTCFLSEYTLLSMMLFLGEPIAFEDEKEGLLIQNICPVKGMENQQENTGSVFLELHTEDGFHPYKPDYLGLTCLRADHDQIAQTVTASILNVLHKLPSTAVVLLRQPLFKLKLSPSFTHDYNDGTEYSKVLPVLSGSIFEPDMCLDYYLMEGTSREAQWALDILKRELLKVMVSIVLVPGDVIIVDNRMAVHGRSTFKPRYDGKDRWLQRMFVTQDFRRSSFSRAQDKFICTPLSIEESIEESIKSRVVAL